MNERPTHVSEDLIYLVGKFKKIMRTKGFLGLLRTGFKLGYNDSKVLRVLLD